MSQLLAHPKTKQDLDSVIATPRACYMLVGEKGSGKLMSARYIAEKLKVAKLDALHVKSNEKGSITIEMAHELLDNLGKHASQLNGYRTVIVESAEAMTIPAQNALLKVIEEPPARTIFLLLVSNSRSILSTIRSRCQTIYVRLLNEVPASHEVQQLARGRAGLAMELLDSAKSNDIQMDIQNDIRKRAKEILEASPLERIVLVDKLAGDKHQAEILDWLAHDISQAVRKQNATSQALQSMQNYFIYSNAGVASKHALTEMMIRL